MFRLPTKPCEASSFSFFPLCPPEIRLHIWRFGLQYQRIIRLTIKCRTTRHTTPIDGKQYSVHADGCELLSKLLHINSESRQAAMEFYRVHLPCTFSKGPSWRETGQAHTFYFNPEFDFLHINLEGPVRETLIEFFRDLKTTHDPFHVGVLNLAVDLNTLNSQSIHQLSFADSDQDARKAFTETLSQLRKVFFVSTPRAGRQNFGWPSGINVPKKFFNRSYPIMARTSRFELLRDPRPIIKDLKLVYTGQVHPRRMIQLWRELLQRWDISAPHIQYKVLLACTPIGNSNQIYGRASAESWLRMEEEAWKVGGEPVGATSPPDQAVQAAIGFWLLPIEAFDVSTDGGLAEDRTQMVDLTEHWPELALLNIT